MATHLSATLSVALSGLKERVGDRCWIGGSVAVTLHDSNESERKERHFEGVPWKCAQNSSRVDQRES